jgi:hypothetical protein
MAAAWACPRWTSTSNDFSQGPRGCNMWWSRFGVTDRGAGCRGILPPAVTSGIDLVLHTDVRMSIGTPMQGESPRCTVAGPAPPDGSPCELRCLRLGEAERRGAT